MDQVNKFIKGFQATYISKNTSTVREGAKNFIIDESLDKVEATEFVCDENDYVRSVGGSVSNKGYLESLIITSNMDIVFKIAEESPHCFRFSLNIDQNEIPICFFGEYSNYYGKKFIFLKYKYIWFF